jgi:WD40 repeat protein
MRVIDAFDAEIRTLCVSPDGRFLVAAAGFSLGVWNWITGDAILKVDCSHPVVQLCFIGDGNTIAYATGAGLARLAIGTDSTPKLLHAGMFSGGIAISPDGKTIAASRAGHRLQTRLERWELPSWRQLSGFDFWSPFQRLQFSRNGELLAGIDNDSFELRFAVSGGLNGRYRVRYLGDGFLAFPHDSRSVAFGWETDIHLMDTRNGALIRRITSPDRGFQDAVFLGLGSHLATVDGSSLMRVWCSNTGTRIRAYDWGVGELTCIAATSDGLTGICGTESGKFVIFDVDD